MSFYSDRLVYTFSTLKGLKYCVSLLVVSEEEEPEEGTHCQTEEIRPRVKGCQVPRLTRKVVQEVSV